MCFNAWRNYIFNTLQKIYCQFWLWALGYNWMPGCWRISLFSCIEMIVIVQSFILQKVTQNNWNSCFWTQNDSSKSCQINSILSQVIWVVIIVTRKTWQNINLIPRICARMYFFLSTTTKAKIIQYSEYALLVHLFLITPLNKIISLLG